MGDRKLQRMPSGHRARNTLSSTKAPSFDFEGPYPSNKSPFEFGKTEKNNDTTTDSTTFRVPSPTSSEEVELEALEQRQNLKPNTDHISSQKLIEDSPISEHLSRLGDSSSLFGSPSALFTFRSSPLSTMVVEREPPKGPLSPRKETQQPPLPNLGQVQPQPEFGKASPLQNRLKPNPVFNIPKPQKAHPEFHRPAQPVFRHPTLHGQHLEQSPNFQVRPPSTLAPSSKPTYGLNTNGDVVEIPRPSTFLPAPTYPQPPPLYSSHATSGLTSVNPYKNDPANVVDLTTEPALFDDRFGAPNPYDYVDPAKAAENIKALLEGAFEDEDDKPRTRGRRKKVDAVVEKLSDRLQHLEVKHEESKDDGAESEGEEEEEDDGTVEGLKVKLLPHQVEGVEWMREKENGKRKKNGKHPKGGILADDVGCVLFNHPAITDRH